MFCCRLRCLSAARGMLLLRSHQFNLLKQNQIPRRCLIWNGTNQQDEPHSAQNDPNVHKIGSVSLPQFTSLTSSHLKMSNKDMRNALTHAERLVGYPTSFLSLRFLLKDEISNLAIHLRRLFETKHPLIETAKNVLSANQQTRGLVVLLLAKAFHYPSNLVENVEPTTGESNHANQLSVVQKHQRKLAEITDMVHVAHLLHSGVIDIEANWTDNTAKDSQICDKADLQLGNNISILIGDFLLATASRELAQIRHPMIVSHISQGIGDFAEGEFLKFELMSDEKSQNDRDLIERTSFLVGGSLLANSCQSMILLASFSEEEQMKAYEIGKHIGIAFELQQLLSNANASHEVPQSLSRSDMIKSLLHFHIQSAITDIKSLSNSEASQTLTSIVCKLETVDSLE